jgi:hypothetical protein
MRRSILLFALSAAILGGCTSAYKSGQTPDDVYYSPERQRDEYVRVKEDDQPKYQNVDEYYDDRYLRMKVHNRVMWSSLDDLNYYNRKYSSSYYNSLNWNNPWSPYTYWNYHYNPYCSGQVVYTSYAKTPSYNHPRVFNLNTYNNTQLTNNNYTNPKASINSRYTNSIPIRVLGTNNNSYRDNSSKNTGSFLRDLFNGATNSLGNSSSNSSGKSSSSVTPSSSSSGRSGGGGTAPVRKF